MRRDGEARQGRTRETMGWIRLLRLDMLAKQTETRYTYLVAYNNGVEQCIICLMGFFFYTKREG